MSWVDDTLADFIAWLAMDPPADDATATRALTLALASVETWLDRPLEKMERTEEDYAVTGIVRLRAWPVESVSSVVIGNGPPVDVSMLAIDKRVGHVCMPTWSGWTTLVYVGGYDPLPPDLEFALWQVAAAYYPSMASAAGVETGGAVRRITTPDVGTIEYATAAAAGGGQADRLLGATLSPQIEALLTRYRAESVVGGA